MDIEQAREYALTLPGATEDMPYGPDWLIFRIEGKIFMLIWLESPVPKIAVKLPPEEGIDLRERHAAITPAYHLNKTHWNDIAIENTFPDDRIEAWIKESYDLVFQRLPAKTKIKYEK